MFRISIYVDKSQELEDLIYSTNAGYIYIYTYYIINIYIYIFKYWLLVWNLFSHSVGNVIIPTDDSSIIFQRARFKPPPSSIETIGSLGHSLMEFLVLLASGNGKP